MKVVIIIASDVELQKTVSMLLKDHYRTAAFSDIRSALDFIYNDTPALVVVEIGNSDERAMSLLNLLKEDPLFSHLPILAVFAHEVDPTEWENMRFEDYLRREDLERDILARVKLGVLRLERVAEINPLTRLPGNLYIVRQIQRRLDNRDIFSIAYADLDNFKPFNDRYGFGRGDDLIRMTGRIIFNVVKSTQSLGCFVGHIGGDDFIIIMKPDLVEYAAQTIVEQFDRVVAGFYDPGDWDTGYITAKDRQGHTMKFPVTSISIGITDTERRIFTHHGELMEAASEMKRYAKQFAGSCYKMDQRKKDIARE